MKSSRERVVFAIHVAFALLSVALLALDMVKAEAALTNGEMLALNGAPEMLTGEPRGEKGY
jgi:hypothetical protein